jgi:hypothetical protein
MSIDVGVGIAAGALIGAAAAGAYGYSDDPAFPAATVLPGTGNYVGNIRVCSAVPTDRDRA